MQKPFCLITIIITYNSERWYRNCLLAIMAAGQQAHQIIVVDNASQDNTASRIKNDFPEVEVISLTENIGYGAAANVGLRAAVTRGAEYVLLLNADTKVERGCFEGLVEAASAHPEFGIISPLQFDYDGVEPDPIFARYIEEAVPTEVPHLVECETVIGAAMLIKRAVLVSVGGFDPEYFMYCEEDDFCRRTRFHGFRIGVTSLAKICHWHTVRHTDKEWNLRGIRFRNIFLYDLKDPANTAAGHIYGYFRYTLVRRLASAVRKRRWALLVRTIWVQFLLLPRLPRILKVRSLERRGVCHL